MPANDMMKNSSEKEEKNQAKLTPRLLCREDTFPNPQEGARDFPSFVSFLRRPRGYEPNIAVDFLVAVLIS